MAEKGIPYLKDCMAFYNQLHLPDNSMDIVVVKILAKLMEKYGYLYIIENQYITNYNMRVTPSNIFSNMSALTKDSYAWHMYFRSWGTGFSMKQTLRNRFPKIYTVLQLVLHKKFGLIYKVVSL